MKNRAHLKNSHKKTGTTSCPDSTSKFHRKSLNLSILLPAILLGLLSMLGSCKSEKPGEKEQTSSGKTNFVIIFVDDMGYGDLGCYGHPTIRTPNIDKMAAEGQRWTNFYVAANVCTPSRAGLLTGRLPARTGMDTNGRRVFFPDSEGGLPQSEITIARLLKQADYQTACIGKWHLGHLPEFLPTSHGFDYYFGIPYSNDMDPATDLGHRKTCLDPKIEYFNVPLMRNEEIIERPANQHTVTKRYTEEAVRFITENKEKPFFLYLAHTMPHVPLFVSEDFAGKSERGLFGDVVEELDWSVGQVLNTLDQLDLDEKTCVVFTSDNGPWVVLDHHGGSAGPLYGAKATSYEGGMRVPAIFRWPGKIQPDIIHDEIGSTLDLLPTISRLAGVPLPDDRKYDGYDLSPVLITEEDVSPREEMFYYHGLRLFAVRKGDYKLYFYKNNPRGYPQVLEKLENYQLFNLQHDPSERFNLAGESPEIVEELLELAGQHTETMEPVENQLDKWPNAKN